jgi:hypothetical protein
MKKNVATKKLLDGEEDKDQWKMKKLNEEFDRLKLLDGEGKCFRDLSEKD